LIQRQVTDKCVVRLPHLDIRGAAAKTYDLEVWLPSQNQFREIFILQQLRGVSGETGFNPLERRRREKGSSAEFVHTLNGSGFAVGRTLVAILENYQQADGSVIMPEALRPYLRGMDRIKQE
jgi:seryl-tRNA synthetase